MRQEALRRTNEMHRRSRNNNVQAAAIPAPVREIPEKPSEPEEAPEKSIEETKKAPDPESSGKTAINKPAEKNGGALGGILSDIFGGGKLDSDKIILIALIFILAREGTDIKLLMALGYILM